MAKYKAKIFFTLSLTAFAIASLVLTIFNNNPFNSVTSVFSIFYCSLFVSIFGISTLLIILFKRRVSDRLAADTFWSSARVSLLIAAVITILLALQGMRVLDLWVGIPLTLAILMMELFFRGNKYKRQNEG
jgi:hypothetical protein